MGDSEEPEPRESAAEQAKRDYDEWKYAAGHLVTKLANVTSPEMIAKRAQVMATLAQAAATRLQAEANWTAVQQAGTWAAAVAEPERCPSRFMQDGVGVSCVYPVHDRGIMHVSAGGLQWTQAEAEASAAPEVFDRENVLASFLDHGFVGMGGEELAVLREQTAALRDERDRLFALVPEASRPARRANRDAGRWLDAGDEVGGPWDDYPDPLPQSQFGESE